jgi:glycosyltransferase involved in cell wall biosynthesis
VISSYTRDLSLVCPAYNEAENIEQLLGEWDEALRATSRAYEMILVDDASTDHTPEIVQAAMLTYPRLRWIRMFYRSGQSAALAAGFDAARGQWLITSDADLQNNPVDLPRMLSLTEHFDMVCGWRRERKDPWTKRLTSWFANARRRKLLDDGVHDSGCGLKVFRREVADSVLRFHGMHRFLPALARIEGFSVAEVPVQHRPRVRGQSKYWIFNRFLGPIQDLRGVAWYRRRHLQYAAEEVTERARDGKSLSRAG